MTKYWKIIVPILFALAIALGLLQRKNLPDFSFGSHKTIAHFSAAPDQSLAGFYEQSKQLAATQTQTATTTFLAVGDIMLSRNVAAAIKQNGDDDYPFRQTADVLKSTNFNFANLEGPVAPGRPIIGGNSLIFGDSSSSLQSLKDYNFQIINLANNHAFDQGLEGVDATRSVLDSLGIAHEGTGDSLDQAWTPAVVTSNGIKICFVGASYSSVNDGGQTTNNYVARIQDIENLKLQIENSKKMCDFVVATMHAGTEYTRTHNLEQTTFAHTAIDDGADIVIGAHPHWVQTIEKYNNKYIFYSLGNFIFDQAWSQNTMEGLTLKITLSKSGLSNSQTPGAAGLDDLQGSRLGAKLESIQLLPIIIENSQPRPATEQETKNILSKINQAETILK